MSELKETYKKYSSDYLIERRALGNQLSAEAQIVIEEVLNERGLEFPPLPKESIDATKSNFKGNIKKTSNLEIGVKFFITILLLAFAKGISKTIAHTIFGIVFTLIWVAYCIFEFFRRANLSEEEKAEEEKNKEIEESGISDLMLASADGDLNRVKELFAYGANLNTLSHNNSTALMYATRNNHLEVVKFLIENGADIKISNYKKSTALTIAKSFNHQEIYEYLLGLKK